MGCNFKLIRESLTEKVTGKQKLGVREPGIWASGQRAFLEEGTPVKIPQPGRECLIYLLNGKEASVVAVSMREGLGYGWASIEYRLCRTF